MGIQSTQSNSAAATQPAQSPAAAATQLSRESIEEFKNLLRQEEKAQNSVGKYIRDITAFVTYAGTKPLTKEIIIDYKDHLRRSGYKPSSINSIGALSRFRTLFLSNSCSYKYQAIASFAGNDL